MYKKVLIALGILFLVAVAALGYFLCIGEPVDAAQMELDCRQTGNQLRLDIYTTSSGIALRGLRVRQSGTSLNITLRKVPVTALNASGRVQKTLDLTGIQEVRFAGKVIWSRAK